MSEYSEEEKREWNEAWLEWYNTCMLDKCTDEHIVILCRPINKIYKKVMDYAKEKGRYPLEPELTEYENYGHPDSPYFREAFHILEYDYLKLYKKERQIFKENIYLKSGGDPTKFYCYFKHKNTFSRFLKQKYISQSSYDGDEGESPDLERSYASAKKKQIEFNDLAHTFFFGDKYFANKTDAKVLELTSDRERAALYCRKRNVAMCAVAKEVGMGKTCFTQLGNDIITHRIPDYECENELSEQEKTTFDNCLDTVLDEWADGSELGRWIMQNFSGRKKMHYSPQRSASSDESEHKSIAHNEQRSEKGDQL